MIHVTIVKELPKAKRSYHTPREFDAIFNRFMRQEAKFGTVDSWASSYKNIDVARSCLQVAVNRRELPIEVRKIDDELYFIRTDM